MTGKHLELSHKAELEKIPGFVDLTAAQKEQFVKQDAALWGEIEHAFRLRASIGNRLLTIRSLCKKGRVYMAWLRYRGIPYATAKVYIQAAVTAKIYLPVNFAHAYFELGGDKINVGYVLENPPKNTNDPVYVKAYSKEMREAEKAGKKVSPHSKEKLISDAWFTASNKLALIPEQTPKAKRDAAVEVMSAIAYQAGFTGEISVKPAKPAARPGKGRPTVSPKTIEGKRD
jgi:hypothetical protein